MTARLSLTHAILLALVALTTTYIAWSAISASTRLFNLIVVVPVAVIIALLIVAVAVSALTGRAPDTDMPPRAATLWDLVLLACFAAFCLGLMRVGFDVATFVFVWLGVVLGGERRLWLPPVYSALFTLLLVKGLGALFPFPMPLMVL